MTDERAAVLTATEKFASDVAARAGEGDELRTMPADLVAAAKEAGLFRLALPRSLGGLELDPATIIQIIETLSWADGSAGWTVLIGNTTAFFAWLDPAVATEMIAGRPDFASTSMFGPFGQAVPDGHGFTISGRWPFNSGCPHSEWLQVGVFVMDGERPRLRDEDTPDWRFAFIPRDAAEIEDTWDAVGLRGTGSHHLSISGKWVAEERVAPLLFEPARHDGPLWKLSLFALSGILMVGFPLGVARRALDEFTLMARSKIRGGATKTVAQDGHAQVQLAQAEAGVQAARAFVLEVVAELWEICCAGESPSLQKRARMLLAVNHAMRAGTEAVDAVFHLAGAEAVFADHPLQRCFRDIHTGNQHYIFSPSRDQGFAKVQFGLDHPAYMI